MLLKDSLKVIEDLGDLPQRLELDIQLSWKDGMGGFHMVESDGIFAMKPGLTFHYTGWLIGNLYWPIIIPITRGRIIP